MKRYKKNMIRVAVFGCLVAIHSAVSALDLRGVPVLNEVSYPNSDSCLAWVYGTSAQGTLASCANPDYPTRLVFDMCTPAGKSWLSIILAYEAQGKTMKIKGKGVCDLWHNTESVDYLRLNEGG